VSAVAGQHRAGTAQGEVREEPPPQRPTAEQGPEQPTEPGRRRWWGVLKRTVREYRRDDLPDWAAALTYYGILSLFPALLVMVTALRLFGASTVHTVTDNLLAVAPGPVKTVLRGAVENLEKSSQGTAGVLGLVSLGAALWSASRYVAAFMRASNAIYDVPEGRPVWKKLRVRLGITIVTGVLLAASALAVVFTGQLAEQFGRLLGISGTTVKVWNVAKWPVLVVVISLVFAILYWAAPNARQGGFRWITPGGLVAVLVWLLGSAGFGLYVAYFGRYNKTYGALAAIVIFLVWLYLTNTAVLLGAELDAELARGRAIAAGHPPEAEPYTELRDDRKVDGAQRGELRGR
jgi:membrane protein